MQVTQQLRRLLKAKSPVSIHPDQASNLRAFTTAAPSLWNSLPASIRFRTDLPTFKLQLKTHLWVSFDFYLFLFTQSYYLCLFYYVLLLFTAFIDDFAFTIFTIYTDV